MLVGRLVVDALSELRQAKEANRHADGASARQRERAHPHAQRVRGATAQQVARARQQQWQRQEHDNEILIVHYLIDVRL